jgi:hypothetical protein
MPNGFSRFRLAKLHFDGHDCMMRMDLILCFVVATSVQAYNIAVVGCFVSGWVSE